MTLPNNAREVRRVGVIGLGVVSAISFPVSGKGSSHFVHEVLSDLEERPISTLSPEALDDGTFSLDWLRWGGVSQAFASEKTVVFALFPGIVYEHNGKELIRCAVMESNRFSNAGWVWLDGLWCRNYAYFIVN